MQDTPMQRGFDALRDAWLQATEDPRRRLLVWRLPANANRLLAAFFELQRHATEASLPDYLLRMDTAYELGFRYSRQLKQDLLDRYLASQDALREQDIDLGWRGPHTAHADSAAGTLQVLASFAEHHATHLRLLAVVLEPERCVPGEGFERWIDAALAATPDSRLRLVLVDTVEHPYWQDLVQRHGDQAAVISADVDMFQIARDSAAQTGGRGPEVLHRQLLADLMLLVERGSPAQVVARAERARALATRHGWQDQVAVVQMMEAGAWLKHADHGKAIAAYRQAGQSAGLARGAGNPAGAELALQSVFGEAGCWVAAGQPGRAAPVYLQAAQAASAIPHPMFALEGQRMAGWCLAQDGQREAARDELLEAIRIAKPLSPADRRATTLPQALWDLLQLQDRPRSDKLAAVSATYLEHSTALLSAADAQARALGPQPPRPALDAIELQLDAQLEEGFHRAQQAREQLIQAGDAFFRSIVAVGRDYLDRGWNGLPEIQHPLASAPEQWTQAPAMQPLPDPAPLLEPPAPRAATEGAVTA